MNASVFAYKKKEEEETLMVGRSESRGVKAGKKRTQKKKLRAIMYT